MSKDVAGYIVKLTEESLESEIENTKRMVASVKNPELFDVFYWKKFVLEFVRQHFLIVRKTSHGFRDVFQTGMTRHSIKSEIVEIPNIHSKHPLDDELYAINAYDFYLYPEKRRYYIVIDPFLQKLILEVLVPLKLKWRVDTDGCTYDFIISWESW